MAVEEPDGPTAQARSDPGAPANAPAGKPPGDRAGDRASDPGAEPAAAARRLLRTALKGSLATLAHDSGHPYASLVLVATAADATPILLLSQLALHTRNLERDRRASLLITAASADGDPMAASRLTLMGEARRTAAEAARRRYLARHPAAAGYAAFADFVVYALDICRAHFIGGFGRIVDLPREALLAPTDDAAALLAAEPEILAHMNEDHADAIALMAERLADGAPGPWRMAGIDPDGVDLLHCSNALRIAFPRRVRSPLEARAMLSLLARRARGEAQRDQPA
jgi:putative heme iron utilization protein